MWLKFLTSRGAGRATALGLAWFAFLWAVARACVQAVTGDEAQDYLFYAAHNNPSQWDPAANNHMLNSIGERLFASIFGLSALSVRIPTLLGAAIYIYVAYRLCEAISAEWKVRIPLFVCLVYNPFIFDFFVAARGYGIANAFLIAAIAISASWHLHRHEFEGGGARELTVATALSSALIGLAFAANFSLAFTGAAAILLLLIWAIRAKSASQPKLMSAAAVPGLLVVLLIPSWTLLHFPKSEIVAGTKSLKTTLSSLAESSMHQPSPYLINPLLIHPFELLREYLLPVVGALAFIQLLCILGARVWKRESNPHTAWLCAFGAVVSGIFLLAVGEHRLAYRLFRLLLPVSRTGLFFLPLVTLMAGIAAAVPAFSRGARISRNLLIGSLSLLSIYFFFCMRLTYFQEWDYQTDLKDAYKVLACYNHERNIQDVESSWEYHAGMNFQRLLSSHETFGPFSSTTPHAAGHEVYILERNFERDFIAEQGLKIVFQGDNTGMVIAVRPDLADAPGGTCYVWPLP